MGPIVSLARRGTLCIVHLQEAPGTETAVWLQPGDLVRISGAPSPDPVKAGTKLEGPLLPILECQPDPAPEQPRPANTANPMEGTNQ